MASQQILTSALTEQDRPRRAYPFFTGSLWESRRFWLIPHAVFLLTLLPSQAGILSAQSEKDVATLEEAESLCRAGSKKKAEKAKYSGS